MAMGALKKTRLLCAIIWLIACSPVFANDASDDGTGKDDTQVYPIYGDVQLVSTLKLQYDKPRIVSKAVYPQLQSETMDDRMTIFNQRVLDLVDEKIAEFKTHVSANQTAFKSNLYIDHATSFIQSGKTPIISIRFSVQGYVAGMAHPYHHHFVLNYDLENDEPIELTDLFNPEADFLTVLSHYTRTTLHRHLRDQHLIDEGTAPKLDNFKNWNIKSNGLLITFDEFQVAPYIDGAQTVLVPYAVLRNIIDPDSILAACVASKRRCSRNNVLTGGFIDEAANTRAIYPHHRLLNPTFSQL